MLEDRFLKRLRKKARKGVRGWPIATIAFYGPDLSRATKVAVGIVPSEDFGGGGAARLESGSRRHSRRPRDCKGDIGLYRDAWNGVGRDDGSDHRLPSPGGNRLRRRMVSGLRILARTRPLHRAEGPLIFAKHRHGTEQFAGSLFELK